MISPEATDEFRWVVRYNDPSCRQDVDLLRGDHRRIFCTEGEAKLCAKEHMFKGKPEYWQPSIHKQQKYMIYNEEWREVKK